MQYNIIDVTSDQYKQDVQRIQTLRTQLVIWLIVLALGVALIPLTLITGWIRSDVARLETDLLTVQNALLSAQNPSAEAVKLGTEIAGVQQLISTMQTVTLPSGVNWPQIAYATKQFDATTIAITSFTQSTDKIQIAGRATSNDAVVRYQQTLLDSAAFKDVVVISMSTIPPTPTPAVTPDAEAAAVPVDVNVPLGNVEFVIDIIVGTIKMGTATP